METTFTALCERAGRWWTIRIPQLEGLTAQARSVDQVEIMARQVIARHLGVPPESLTIDVITDAPAAVSEALQARHVARQAVEAAAMATRAALEALAAEGHTFHDAATLLGLTPSEVEVFGPRNRGTAPIQGGTVQGGTVQGGTVQGGTVQGSTVQGGTVQGSTVQGSTVQGSTVQGGTVQGGTVNNSSGPMEMAG